MYVFKTLQIFLKVAEDSGVDSVELSGEISHKYLILYLLISTV